MRKIDFVLAVGGGSVIDGSKYLVAAALYDGDSLGLFRWNCTSKKALPLGVVLTLPATGSESNGTSSDFKIFNKWKKRYFASSLVYPKFTILDPSVMGSLDDRQLANGLVDALFILVSNF